MRKLLVTSGPAAGHELEIDRELVVGRGEVDVVVDDSEMSRRHALLRPVDDGVEVEDLGSANGTLVDGERITKATIARSATIKMGQSEFTVDVDLPQATRIGEDTPREFVPTAVQGVVTAAPQDVTRTLRVVGGPGAGQEMDIDRELVVGRDEADVTIADPELSRHHAALRPVADGVEVEDLGSSNGTFVDGERISQARTIAIRGTIKMGESEFVIDVSLPQATPESVSPQMAATVAGVIAPATPADVPPPVQQPLGLQPDAPRPLVPVAAPPAAAAAYEQSAQEPLGEQSKVESPQLPYAVSIAIFAAATLVVVLLLLVAR